MMASNLNLEPDNKNLRLGPLTQACNPSYSGGRDQEDCGSRPAWANSSQNPISEISNTHKKAGLK
jgi:hypothetical protein